MRRLGVLGLMCTLFVAGYALSDRDGRQPAGIDAIRFELLEPRGIQFESNNGKTARKYQPQTMLAGVALFDYNDDGLLDIYLVNGATMPGLVKENETYYNRLFRNNGDGS